MTAASIILIIWMIIGMVFSIFIVITQETDVSSAVGKITGQTAKILLLSILIYYSGGWQ